MQAGRCESDFCRIQTHTDRFGLHHQPGVARLPLTKLEFYNYNYWKTSVSLPMITTEIRHFPPLEDSLPAIVIQVTSLVNSYMVWIGTTDRRPEDIQKVPLEGNLCRDWACAMPPVSVRVLNPRTCAL